MDEHLTLGEPVGSGRTADVYALGDGRVLKLLRPGMPDAEAYLEADAATLVTDAGLSAPRFEGLRRHDGRLGLVYERIGGQSMLDAVRRDQVTAVALADTLAELHAALHACDGGRLPRFDAALRVAILRARPVIGPEAAEAALHRLEALPSGDRLVHGDFHPGNVILTADGPRVIDWLTAGRGPAAADVARTLFLLVDSLLPADIGPEERERVTALRPRFASAYLERYEQLTGARREEIGAWRLPILAARAAEEVHGELPHLRALLATELGSESSAGAQ